MRAAIVIVGAGVVGLSTAYQLARAGLRDILVLERGTVGSGSSGKSLGGFRVDFSTEVNIRFSLESLKALEGFADEFGVDPDLRRIGYLLVTPSEALAARLRENASRLARFGVEVELLAPEEIGARWPYLYTADLAGGTFCARDGTIGPSELAQGYAAGARRQGVTILEGAEVVGIEVRGGRVMGVQTRTERVETTRVLCAAGAWSAWIGRMVGVEIPVRPVRRQVFVTGPCPAIRGEVPQVVEVGKGWVFRREGAGFLIYGPQDPAPEGVASLDWGSVGWAVAAAAHRVPPLAEAEVVGGWAGLYDISPDNHAILGPVPGLEGFYVATGFSGHGIMHSPAAGKAMAEVILTGRARSIDIAPLTIERFARGTLLEEPVTAHRQGDG
ncbi:MAG: FAD-binding oxidoreductase [candidate division NC10 bacterium]|nr:FAD-binding oxidoreductase [candidate division NC10 bacterium]